MTVPHEEMAAIPALQVAEGADIPRDVAERALGAMHEGVIVYDGDGRAILANARAIEIIGIPFADLVTQRAADHRFQPVLDDGTPLPFEERPTGVALRTGERASRTLGVPQVDGLIWVMINSEPLFRDGEAEPAGAITVYTDVTAAKLGAQELVRTEELKSAIMSASLDAILTLTREGEIVDLNDAAVELYRIKPEDAVGTHVTELLPARDSQVWVELLERLRSDPAHLHGRRIEGTGKRSDGSEFPFEASIDSLHAGGQQFFVAFVHDITERKAAERRLADARDAALRASVVKSEFLATMSHEIRTPMNGVIGSLDLMLDSEMPAELADLAQIARTAATDLLGIIDDILDLSRIEADKVERRTQDFDLVALVEGVTDIVAVSARQKGVSLDSYVDPALQGTLRGDPRLLRQVLVNLVGNAVKFTEQGAIVVRAECESAAGAQTTVAFTVRDTGAGIPPEAVATLFDPFTQVDGTSTREHGGSGLGLAISSRLVRLMGGKLAVESEPGAGSTFSFTLPFAVAEAAAEVVRPAPAPLGRPLRVLVVDRSDTAAETLDRYLRAWGMVATRVVDFDSALERYGSAAASETYDVAIVATSAPGEQERELAARLRERAGEQGIFLVALLELGENFADPPAAADSFDAVVGKPIKQSRLYDALAGIQAERAPLEQSGDGEGSRELAGLHVLIAEDNPVNKEVLMRQVQRLGIVADAVENGQEVLDALGERNYDAVLMDCQMPVMDGYTATREIRAREEREGGAAHMPIVAVTANAMREDFERCRECGMDDFVAKPVTLAALSNAIERAVSASRAAAAGEGAGGGEPAPDDTPLGGVDREALASLQEDLGGADALLRIVRLFLEQLDPQADQIEGAAKGAEHETLARMAHRMRSSAATLGATALANTLTELETAALEGDAAACDQLAARFAADVVTTRATFESVLEELDALVAPDS
ncbi:MAG TPA: ATP-binding protein [Solirubrobacteraceae bacterium]|nr:ATP-binding protein [Solirubrobacteraceae bacterium]